MKKIIVEVDNDFVKGDCCNCPFMYQHEYYDINNGFDWVNKCVLKECRIKVEE